MPSIQVARSAPAVDTATALAAAGRRDRLAHLTPVLLAFVAAVGLLVLALAGG